MYTQERVHTSHNNNDNTRGPNWVPSRAHGRRELSLGCGFFSLLLRGKSGASWSAPLVYPLAACQSWRLLEEFPLLRSFSSRYSHLEIWTLPSPSYLSVLRCLGVACGVRRIYGTRALLGSTVDTCSTGGFWRISHIFFVR